MNEEQIIPTIRLDDPDQLKTAAKLRSACIETGFFYLEGHGIESKLLGDVLYQSKLLFQLSEESKRTLTDPVLSRGYTAMGEETLNPSTQKQGDTKEGFYVCREIHETDPRYNPSKLCGPNQWPSPEKTADMQDCHGFRRVMEKYFEQISDIALRMIQLLALALGLEDQHHFDQDFSEPMAALRLLHYAAVRSQPDQGIYAAGAHSDYGMLTLLLTDLNRGLQILTKQGCWIDVTPIRGAFIVNLGDMLERWTNGLFRSTQHRVLTVGDAERYSVPFFYEPNFDTVVQCLPVCCSEENPAKYPPITSGQFLLDKYKQTHADFQPEE
jgi:isopenicillin N synthase-like dioxygenase